MADTQEPRPPLEEAAEAARQMVKWQRVRDRKIIQARSEGNSLRTCAAAIGVHHSTIVVIESQETP